MKNFVQYVHRCCTNFVGESLLPSLNTDLFRCRYRDSVFRGTEGCTQKSESCPLRGHRPLRPQPRQVRRNFMLGPGLGWKPTHLTSVFSLRTSVFTSPHDTMLTAFADVADVKYGCLRMLDGLVSTHPYYQNRDCFGINIS